jgi:hypothetical protein
LVPRTGRKSTVASPVSAAAAATVFVTSGIVAQASTAVKGMVSDQK